LDTDVLIWILRKNRKVKEQFERAVEDTAGWFKRGFKGCKSCKGFRG